MGAKMVINERITTPFVTKAPACRQAVQTGIDLGFGRVIIKGYALSIIQCVNAEKDNRSEMCSNVLDIQMFK